MSNEVANTEYSLTEQDALFVAEKSSGKSSMDALIAAYSDDAEVQEWALLRNDINGKTRDYAKLMLRKKARAVSARRGVKVLTEKFQERIEQLGDLAFDTIEEIMLEGRSEKVRGDLAVEMVRHNVGNPDKDKGGNQNVVIMIGTDPSQQIRVNNEPIEGEIVND